jgi:hypothetical protein
MGSYFSANTPPMTVGSERTVRSFSAQERRVHFQSHASIHADFVAKKPKSVAVIVCNLIERCVQIIDVRGEQAPVRNAWPT